MALITAIILIAGFYIYLSVKRPGLALITAPLVSMVIFVYAGVCDQVPAMALAPAIFMATILTVALSAFGAEKIRWSHTVSKWILLIFLFAAFTVLMIAAMGPVGGYGLIFQFFLIALLINYNITARRSLATEIVSTIGSCMRQNLPLTTALEWESRGRNNKKTRVLRQINEWLTKGFSLSESIKKGYPGCPGHIVAMIAMAERIDQVPSAIKSIEKDMLEKTGEGAKPRPVHPFYPVIVLSTAFFISLGLTVFVTPKFRDIFADFQCELPWPTKMLLSIYEAANNKISIMGALEIRYSSIFWIFIFLILAMVPWAIYARFRPRRPQQPRLISRLGDFIRWHLPVFRWFERNYSLTQTVQSLRHSLRAGIAVDKALENSLGLDVNICFRKRLRKWFESVTRGDDIAESARRCGLGTAMAWAFDSKINRGNTPAILEMLEDFHRTNYNYMANLTRFIMWPCITLLTATVVGFVVYAFFSPIVAMIDQVAAYVMP